MGAEVTLLVTARGDRVEWYVGHGDVAAVPGLRRRIMSALRRRASPAGDFAAAEVVVAELLSNAVTHTAGPAWVSLRWDGPHPVVSVADLGSAEPAALAVLPQLSRLSNPELPADELAGGGRGLYLASVLSLDLAVRPRTAGGSIVSATLDLAR